MFLCWLTGLFVLTVTIVGPSFAQNGQSANDFEALGLLKREDFKACSVLVDPANHKTLIDLLLARGTHRLKQIFPEAHLTIEGGARVKIRVEGSKDLIAFIDIERRWIPKVKRREDDFAPRIDKREAGPNAMETVFVQEVRVQTTDTSAFETVRRLGLGSLLNAIALDIGQIRGISRVSSRFDQTNKQVFNEIYRRTGDVIQAVEGTPSGKARLRRGYRVELENSHFNLQEPLEDRIQRITWLKW